MRYKLVLNKNKRKLNYKQKQNILEKMNELERDYALIN